MLYTTVYMCVCVWYSDKKRDYFGSGENFFRNVIDLQSSPLCWLGTKVSTSVFPLQIPKRAVMRKKEKKGERTTEARGHIEWRAAYEQGLSLIESFMSSRPAEMECRACAAALIGSLAARGGWELPHLRSVKNGLIHFPHERVSLGRHQTSQSTQIYGPLKQQASWPPCHHRLCCWDTLHPHSARRSSPSQASVLIVHPFHQYRFYCLTWTTLGVCNPAILHLTLFDTKGVVYCNYSPLLLS